MIRSFCFLLLLALAASCQKEDEVNPAFNTYKIKSGNHHSERKIKKVSGSELKFAAVFDSSAVYFTQNPHNQGDINKLLGFSDCGSKHHSNSARFGWRWFDEKLEIFAYCYVNGEIVKDKVGEVNLGEENQYSITAVDNEYIFSLNGITKSYRRNCSGKLNGYQLYPYFGGDETAPDDVKILIREY